MLVVWSIKAASRAAEKRMERKHLPDWMKNKAGAGGGLVLNAKDRFERDIEEYDICEIPERKETYVALFGWCGHDQYDYGFFRMEGDKIAKQGTKLFRIAGLIVRTGRKVDRNVVAENLHEHNKK